MRHSLISVGGLLLLALVLSERTADPQSPAPQRKSLITKVHPSPISAMKLVAPGSGWVIVQGRLLWTNDDGGVWTDVTPPGPPTQSFGVIYSFDATHTWIVLVDPPGDWTQHYPLRLVRTADGGQTWATLPFDDSPFPDLKKTHAAPAALQFLDSEHGWFLWKIPTGTQLSVGMMLSTKDGGRTWTELPRPPSAHGFSFCTPRDGWMVGSPDGDELWRTRDGGETWEQKTTVPPDNCKQCRPIFNGAPRFQNPVEGAMFVTFQDESSQDGRFVSVAYVTRNGGNSWEPAHVFEPEDSPRGNTFITGVSIIRVFSDIEHGMEIRSELGTFTPPYPPELPPRGLASADFADASHGWFLHGSHKCLKIGGLKCEELVWIANLLSTSDGGRTLKVITPPLPAPPATPDH